MMVLAAGGGPHAESQRACMCFFFSCVCGPALVCPGDPANLLCGATTTTTTHYGRSMFSDRITNHNNGAGVMMVRCTQTQWRGTGQDPRGLRRAAAWWPMRVAGRCVVRSSDRVRSLAVAWLCSSGCSTCLYASWPYLWVRQHIYEIYLCIYILNTYVLLCVYLCSAPEYVYLYFGALGGGERRRFLFSVFRARRQKKTRVWCIFTLVNAYWSRPLFAESLASMNDEG